MDTLLKAASACPSRREGWAWLTVQPCGENDQKTEWRRRLRKEGAATEKSLDLRGALR